MPSGETPLANVFRDIEDINFVLLLIIAASAWISIKLIEWLFPRVADRLPNRFRLYILPLVPVLRLIIMGVAIVALVPQVIAPTSQNLFAFFGAAGIAIGFAFKDYASSLIAGVVTVYERPYRPGDWVRIGNAYGEVKSIGFRALKILTPDDDVVIIPHSKIWNSTVHNSNNGQVTHMCVADFYLEPDHDAAAVARKLRDVALASPYIQLKRDVAVIVADKPWGTHYRLKAYPIDNRQEFEFTTDLTVKGKAALKKLAVAFVSASVALSEGIASYSGEALEQTGEPGL